jgi:hypothetical protein
MMESKQKIKSVCEFVNQSHIMTKRIAPVRKNDNKLNDGFGFADLHVAVRLSRKKNSECNSLDVSS